MFCFEIGAEIGWEGFIKYFCFVSPNLATLPVKFTGQSSLCSVVAVVGVGWVWWSCWWAKQTNHPKKAEKKESTITASMLSISLSNVTCVYSSFKHKKNPFRIKIISSPVTPPPAFYSFLPLSLSVVMDVACSSDWKGNRLFSLCVSQQSGAVNRQTHTHTHTCAHTTVWSCHVFIKQPASCIKEEAKHPENTQTASTTKSLSKM